MNMVIVKNYYVFHVYLHVEHVQVEHIVLHVKMVS